MRKSRARTGKRPRTRRSTGKRLRTRKRVRKGLRTGKRERKMSGGAWLSKLSSRFSRLSRCKERISRYTGKLKSTGKAEERNLDEFKEICLDMADEITYEKVEQLEEFIDGHKDYVYKNQLQITGVLLLLSCDFDNSKPFSESLIAVIDKFDKQTLRDLYKREQDKHWDDEDGILYGILYSYLYPEQGPE